MRRNHFTNEQIIGIRKEHEAGTPVAELCHKHGVSDVCIYKMESQFRRPGRVRGQAVKDAGRREYEAETAPGRCDARQRRFGYRRLHMLFYEKLGVTSQAEIFVRYWRLEV